jgi:cyclophilin family peptidyl-prolyl cis-trans isomerase
MRRFVARTLRSSGITVLALGLGLGSSLISCSAEKDRGKPRSTAKPPTSQPAERETAVLSIRDLGDIRIELLADTAPETVANFKKLAGEGFYDGTTFHRVVPGFMIQGGDPRTKDRDPRNDGKGGPGYTIPDEINEVAHVRGVVSMANKGRADTGGSQFFILVEDAPHLNRKHAAFGLVVAGLDLVDQIIAVPRDQYGRHGPKNRPIEDVVVEQVRIEPARTARTGEPAPRAETETLPEPEPENEEAE